MSHEQSVIGAVIREFAETGPRFWRGWALAIVLVVLASVPNHASAETLKIVMLGDSLTAGYGLPPSQAFPVRLQAALKMQGLDVEIVNAGVSGDTTAGGLARVDWSVPDDTDGVILELGANDALRGLPVANARKNLDGILSKLNRKNIPVLLAGMHAPANLGGSYGKEFAAIYSGLAQKYQTALYPFFLEGVAGENALNQADGIHPNAKGIEVLVQRMMPVVGKWLKTKIRARSNSG